MIELAEIATGAADFDSDVQLPHNATAKSVERRQQL
jgi:hypothetical protein